MKPYYTEDGVTIWHGDCVEIMAAMDAGSVDAVVCDPPYGLEFMGKDWDSFGADTGNGYSEKPNGKRSRPQRRRTSGPRCALRRRRSRPTWRLQ